MSDGSEPSRVAPIAAVVLVLALIGGFLYLRGRRLPPPSPAASSVRAQATEAPPPPSPDRASERVAEARRARDAMREQILEALRKRDAGPPAVAATRGAPPKAASAEAPKGHYEASYIQQNFREDMFPLLKSCYESALVRKPQLGGKLVLKFTIAGDPEVGGVVEDADFADESDLKDTEMETCVRESLMTLTFDKPPSGGGIVHVTYPILFAPGDEPPEGGAE